LILHLVFLAVLILCNAFFSAAEVALISLKPVTLEQLSKKGKSGRILGSLSLDTGRFLATVQVGVTFAGFLASAFAADTFSDPVAHWVYYDVGFTGLSEATIDHISVVLITMALSYFSLVFGELVPKQIALRYASFVALHSAIPIHYFAKLASPLVWLLNNSVKAVMLPFGAAGNSEKVTEEEIRSLINMGEKDGLIDADERRIIQNVFELDDILCGDIMTRRGAVFALEAGAPPEEVERHLMEKRFSAYPVYRGTIDRVIGILYAADYFRLKLKMGQPPLPVAVMRKPHFVPEGATVLQVLHDMQREQFEIAVVLDEFGGTAGVVTRDDLLEELVGSLHPRKPEESLIRVSETIWESGGLVRLGDVERDLHCKLPEDDERPDTVAGLLMAELDDIPKPGDIVEIGGLRFTVQSLEGRRITRVRIELSAPGKDGTEEEPAPAS
jgi:putative hemolysin